MLHLRSRCCSCCWVKLKRRDGALCRNRRAPRRGVGVGSPGGAAFGARVLVSSVAIADPGPKLLSYSPPPRERWWQGGALSVINDDSSAPSSLACSVMTLKHGGDHLSKGAVDPADRPINDDDSDEDVLAL